MQSSREHRQHLYERLIGSTIADKFVVTRLMGFGGMGAVYEAVQKNMNRSVALKYIPTHNPTTAARFEREAMTVSQLRHPHTVTVFDYGQTEDGYLFLSMELLSGKTLTDVIDEQSPLEPHRAVHIATQMCRALNEAHNMGIVHRDIKPDNVILIDVDGDSDFVKILDFGIAKVVQGEDDVQLTGDGRIVGTPRYMSPEQILAIDVDLRSDIYGLGCILFEMLCGSPPFLQKSSTALMISHTQDPPPSFAERLSNDDLNRLPKELEAVVRKAMAKHPDERQQTMEELRHELQNAIYPDGYPATISGSRIAPKPGDLVTQTTDRPAARKPLLSATVVILLIAVLAFGGLMMWRFNSEPSDANLAIDASPGMADENNPDHPNLSDRAVAQINSPAKEDKEQVSYVVVIKSSPLDATVYDEETPIGQTPLTLTFDDPTPLKTYRLQKKGYQSKSIDVIISPDTDLTQQYDVNLAQEVPPEPIVPPKSKASISNDPPRRPAKKTVDKVRERESSKQEVDAANQEPPSQPQIDLIEDAPRPRIDRL